MIEEPAAQRVAADMLGPDFVSGVEKGRWRLANQAFPVLDIAIAATEPNGEKKEYLFRFELTNYPAQAPMVRIWDADANAPLAREKRPQGNGRVALAFQVWGSDTVYRPWDRCTGPHNGNADRLAHLAWRSDRTLTFILEDLHGILNLNARTLRHRAAA
ncbi:MAG: hypothetical protein ACJ8FS_17090 [Sphingomicrobium sp.]